VVGAALQVLLGSALPDGALSRWLMGR